MRFVIEIPDEIFAAARPAVETGAQSISSAAAETLSGGAAPDFPALSGQVTARQDAFSAGEANYGGVAATAEHNEQARNGGEASGAISATEP